MKADSAKRRAAFLKRAIEEAGGFKSEDELGFTQFVSGMIRVAHLAFVGKVNGLGGQFDMMMEECARFALIALMHSERV